MCSPSLLEIAKPTPCILTITLFFLTSRTCRFSPRQSLFPNGQLLCFQVVVHTGVGGGGAGGATAPPKVLIRWKFGKKPIESGKNPLKSGKNLCEPSQTFWKYKQKWRPTCFDLKNGARIDMKSFFLEVSFFRTSLGEFGQNSFAPPKFCLLLHLCWSNITAIHKDEILAWRSCGLDRYKSGSHGSSNPVTQMESALNYFIAGKTF